MSSGGSIYYGSKSKVDSVCGSTVYCRDERYVGIEGTMKSIKCRCQRLRLMCAAIHIVPIWLSQE